MSQTMTTAMPALTRLAEDEEIFRASVYEFADKEIRPLVRQMDEESKIPRPLIDRVLLNDGKARFAAHDLGDSADRSYSVTLADIDRDGDLDVVVGNDAPDAKRVRRVHRVQWT